MSKSQAAPQSRPEAPAPDPNQAGTIQELKVSAHLMTLDAGMFCVVNEPSPAVNADGLPGVRISPPPGGGGAVDISGFRADGWLSAQGDAALVKVRKGPAQLLVTVYQMAGMPDAAPRLQVMRLGGQSQAGGAQAGGAQAGGAGQKAPQGPPAAQPAASAPQGPQQPQAREVMDVLAHIQTRGDVGAKFGAWLGEPGSGKWIEGIAIAAPKDIPPEDLSYQVVLGRGWLSPWVEAGEYCGSRGMALPLLGLRVRLQGKAAEKFALTCEASFVDGTTSGPVGSDETCESESLAALEAVRVTLTPRGRGRSRRRS